MDYNNSNIGFSANISNQNKETSLSSLEKILEFEIEDANSLKQRILEELKEINDLTHNIKILEEKIKEIEKLDKIRDELIQEIFHLENEPYPNIEKGKELFEKINKINEKLNKILPILLENIQKLMLNQTTLIYSKEEENKKKIREIHNLASKFQSKLKMINLKYSSFEPHLNEIYSKFQKIKFERRNSK